MENKLQPSQPGALQAQTPNTTFNLPGNNNTLVAHTDAVNNTYSVMMVGGAPPMPGSPNAVHTITLNTDFYHLLVVGDDELNPQYCHCLVRKDRAITESTSKELKAAYAALPEDAISVLKTYPAIIATENHTYGKTDEDHYAAYGLIVDVKIQDNGIKVYYQILNWIPQQKINELRFELGIEGCSGTNELNRMHWAIKKINQDDISAINAFQRTYESEMDSVVATLEGNVSAAMPELDLSEYEVKVQLLVDAITINKQRIAAKIKEPTSIASLEDTDSLLIEIGTLIDGFNKKIKENNEIVRDLKTKKVLCKKQVWEYLAELLKADVAAYNKALSDLDTEIKALKDKMEQLKKDATAKKKEANELNKQIVNTEATIDSINVLLDNSGFEGFHLRAKDGVANTYEVIRPDGTVAEKLSEGERNFIAFLYYYHLVKGSLNSEAVKDKIVVIDDPVSSMDSGALFIVSALVREMIEVCYNNTDYRSHKVDGDYIKQIFILTHNVYFHKEITHHQAKRYHSVSFYMIRKIENISSVKPNSSLDVRKRFNRSNYCIANRSVLQHGHSYIYLGAFKK